MVSSGFLDLSAIFLGEGEKNFSLTKNLCFSDFLSLTTLKQILPIFKAIGEIPEPYERFAPSRSVGTIRFPDPPGTR